MSTYNILPRPPLRRNDPEVDMRELFTYLHRLLIPTVDQTYQTITLNVTGISGIPTVQCQFVQQMKQLTLYIPTIIDEGVGPSLTISGLPPVFAPTFELQQNVVVHMSNLFQLGAMYIAAGGTTIQFAAAHLNVNGWNVDGLNRGIIAFYVQWMTL